MIDVIQEYKAEIDRLRVERDIVWDLLVDQEQFNKNVSRETAQMNVNNEVMQRLQRVGAL